MRCRSTVVSAGGGRIDARISVPPPGADSIVERAVHQREPLAHADQAEAARALAAARSRAPSSRTIDLDLRRRDRSTETSTCVAPACLPTLVSASWTSR